ncbi:ComEA family DNA-binding protein [Desulfatiglans anilini]|uniref:ComEA family DNA-binding protein n=1 Tax=Desulfatiglans anilini TaxID=90728 RepID=UPI000A0372B5|nr:helix-hairpin-helix domain-containing protein [Desulfatiglans anilini]
MRRLVSRIPRDDHRLVRGGLLLLLLLLIPQALAALLDSASPPIFRGEAVFVEVVQAGGEASVFAFEREPRLSELTARLATEGRAGSARAGGERLLRSGDRVEFWEGGPAAVVMPQGMSAFFKWTLRIPIELNRVDLEGLTVLPGIGPRLAGRIVAERERRGGFKSLEELMLVEGIGPVTWSRIRPYLTLEDSRPLARGPLHRSSRFDPAAVCPPSDPGLYHCGRGRHAPVEIRLHAEQAELYPRADSKAGRGAARLDRVSSVQMCKGPLNRSILPRRQALPEMPPADGFRGKGIRPGWVRSEAAAMRKRTFC